jgi:hypothetical protein
MRRFTQLITSRHIFDKNHFGNVNVEFNRSPNQTMKQKQLPVGAETHVELAWFHTVPVGHGMTEHGFPELPHWKYRVALGWAK